MTRREELAEMLEGYSGEGCLTWPHLHLGYSYLEVDGERLSAHHVACELAHGPAPDGKPLALHRCENRHCVAPAHVYWGSPEESMTILGIVY